MSENTIVMIFNSRHCNRMNESNETHEEYIAGQEGNYEIEIVFFIFQRNLTADEVESWQISHRGISMAKYQDVGHTVRTYK